LAPSWTLKGIGRGQEFFATSGLALVPTGGGVEATRVGARVIKQNKPVNESSQIPTLISFLSWTFSEKRLTAVYF